jgi:hypothetical protein
MRSVNIRQYSTSSRGRRRYTANKTITVEGANGMVYLHLHDPSKGSRRVENLELTWEQWDELNREIHR